MAAVAPLAGGTLPPWVSRRQQYDRHEAGDSLLTVRMPDPGTELRVVAHYRLTA